MQLNYQERQELKSLSKKFFGASSRWQKLVYPGELVRVLDEKGEPIIVGFNRKKEPLHLWQHKPAEPRALLEKLREAATKWKEFSENFQKQQSAEEAEKARKAQLAQIAKEAAGSVE